MRVDFSVKCEKVRENNRQLVIIIVKFMYKTQKLKLV